MGTFFDNVTPQAVENADSSFREFKIGENVARIKHAEEKFSNSGNPMLVVIFENEDGAEIKHYIVDGEWKMSKLKELFIAFNIPFGSTNIEEWRGKRGLVICKAGEPYGDKGIIYNKISYLKPLPKGNAAPATQQSSAPQKPKISAPVQTVEKQTNPDDGFYDDIPF
jgi:hypothetical protein